MIKIENEHFLFFIGIMFLLIAFILYVDSYEKKQDNYCKSMGYDYAVPKLFELFHCEKINLNGELNISPNFDYNYLKETGQI